MFEACTTIYVQNHTSFHHAEQQNKGRYETTHLWRCWHERSRRPFDAHHLLATRGVRTSCCQQASGSWCAVVAAKAGLQGREQVGHRIKAYQQLSTQSIRATAFYSLRYGACMWANEYVCVCLCVSSEFRNIEISRDSGRRSFSPKGIARIGSRPNLTAAVMFPGTIRAHVH